PWRVSARRGSCSECWGRSAGEWSRTPPGATATAAAARSRSASVSTAWPLLLLLPAQEFEHLVLHALNVRLAQAWIEDLVDRAASGAVEPQVFQPSLVANVLELEPLAPQQQQGQHVAELDARGVRVRGQASKALHQQFVVKCQSTFLMLPRHP